MLVKFSVFIKIKML